MNDIVLEWIVPYVMPKKKRLIKAIMLSALVVFTIDTVLYPILFLPVLLLAVVEFFLFRSWKLEYEYVYVNGDFTISKIIRKEKRKDVFHCDRKDIQYVKKGRENLQGVNIRDYTSGWEKGRVYTLKSGDTAVYIEPNDDFLKEMKTYRKLSE
ncbi:DUF6106 family protein [Lachnospiraceae bacterium 62-35]